MLPAKSPLLKPRSSSIYSGRGSSAFLEGPKKESRPIKDKQWQAEQAENLIEFLIAANYNHHISPKILMTPTRKNFECIFQFLYRILDPHMEWSNKFEDDVILIFKRLRYPFEVKKSALHAVGSPQYWPQLLAALSWLLETIKYALAAEQEAGSNDFLTEEDPNHDDGEKLTYQYLQTAYRSFLAGEDEQPVEDFFGPHYAEKQRQIAQEVAKLQSAKQLLDSQLSQLQSGESLLTSISKRRDDFRTDVDKFNKYIDQLTERRTYLNDSKHNLLAEESSCAAEAEHLRGQKAGLNEQIRNQTVSAADVQDMNIEREKRSEALRAVRSSTEQITSSIYEASRVVTGHVEQITEYANHFNQFGSDLKVMPSSAKYANGIELQLSVAPAGSEEEGNINLDLKAYLKPALKKMKDQYNTKCHQACEDLITLKDQHNQIEDRVSDEATIVEELKMAIQKLDQEAQAAKDEEEKVDGLQQSKASIEEEIGRIKEQHELQISSLQKDIDQAKNLHEQKKAAYTAEKLDMEQKMRKILEQVTDHKMYIHNNLRQVERHTTQLQQQIEESL